MKLRTAFTLSEVHTQIIKVESIMFKHLSEQEHITIVVTDSGLGGLSVTANLVERLKRHPTITHARVIFFNSSFDNNSGYNIISSHAEKIAIFNRALESMLSHFQPDIILIACNTLSVIFPETPFAQKQAAPVIEIVETGVHQIMISLQAQPDASIVIFATPTTISKGSYQQALINNGISAGNIYAVPCGNLADYIEDDATGVETREFVQRCVDSAIAEIARPEAPVIMSLNCTHYGYIKNIFNDCFQKRGIELAEIVNPNPYLADFLFTSQPECAGERCSVSVEMICKVNIFPEVMKSIGGLIGPISPLTLQAMKHYTRDPALF